MNRVYIQLADRACLLGKNLVLTRSSCLKTLWVILVVRLKRRVNPYLCLLIEHLQNLSLTVNQKGTNVVIKILLLLPTKPTDKLNQLIVV